MASARHSRSSSEASTTRGRRRLGGEHRRQHVGRLERAEHLVAVPREFRAQVGVELTAGAPRDCLPRGRLAAGEVARARPARRRARSARLDPTGHRPAIGDAAAVPALVDVVERGDGRLVDAEPRAERRAHLAARPGGVHAGRSACARRSVASSSAAGRIPVAEARRRRSAASAGSSSLSARSKLDVVAEHRGVLGRVGGAADGRAAAPRGRPRAAGRRLRRRAQANALAATHVRSPFSNGMPRPRSVVSESADSTSARRILTAMGSNTTPSAQVMASSANIRQPIVVVISAEPLGRVSVLLRELDQLACPVCRVGPRRRVASGRRRRTRCETDSCRREIVDGAYRSGFNPLQLEQLTGDTGGLMDKFDAVGERYRR